MRWLRDAATLLMMLPELIYRYAPKAGAVIVAVLAILAALLLVGCRSTGGSASREFAARPDAAPVMAEQVDKDARVTTAADRIDLVAARSPEVQPEIARETTEIRSAVAAAPAEDVAGLIRTFEGQLDDREREIARLSAQVEQLMNQELRWQARGLTGLGIALGLAFGVSVAFGGGLVAAAKTWPLMVMAVGCFALAQIVSHPWFMPSMAGFLAAALGYSGWYVWDRNREGRLKSTLQRKAAALQKIVPVLDHARKSATDTVREVLDHGVFERLSDLMSDDEKAVVKEVRRTVETKGITA